jgi:cysteine-rich repeat protein
VTNTESCDDGNRNAGDGCSETCQVESGFSCIGLPSSCMTSCGDGIVVGAEQCDDGNASSSDGCSASCMREPQFVCVSQEPNVCFPELVFGCSCGDGRQCAFPDLVLEPCDDGNLFAGDGCSPACTVEPGHYCHTGRCSSAALCGNGSRDLGEQCDDGNLTDGDGCDATCRIELCGNGLLDPGEACDDDGIGDGDGCSSTCAIEGSGWTCSPGQPCEPTCGDGLVRGVEGCDDQNTIPGDGCSAACQIEDGFVCGAEPSVCTTACGDGLVRADVLDLTPPETCDDGNIDPDDGCDALCQLEAGFSCAGEPTVCAPFCADGLDNDGDGLADFPSDPGCSSGSATVEDPHCQDGLNNDNRIGIDFDGGASLDLDDDGFIDAAFNPATPAVGDPDPQCVGRPWDRTETACGLGVELALLVPLIGWIRRRRRSYA